MTEWPMADEGEDKMTMLQRSAGAASDRAAARQLGHPPSVAIAESNRPICGGPRLN